MKRLPIFLTVAALLTFSVRVTAQDDDQRSAIGEHQRLVERKMAELEAKFEIIAQRLEEKEPERAKRLIEALQQAKEKLIAKKMAEITELLDQRKLNEAEQELDQVILNLEELVRLLLNEKKDSMSRQQEIEMLKKWREEIKRIQKEQKQQTRETTKIAHKDKTMADLAEQIKQVEALIKEQENVIASTEQNAKNGIQALDRVANKQFDVRQQTEQLARDISGEPEGEPVSTQGDPNEPNDNQNPNDQNQNNQGDQNQGDQNQGDQKQGNQNQNNQNQNNQGSPSQSGDQQSKPSDSSQGSPTSSQQAPKQPGQKPLEDAAADQKKAEEQLTEGKAADAQRSEEKALDDLEKALAELKKEQRRIASLPPEAMKQMAKDQQRTEERTADLAREMQKAPKPSNQDGQGNQGNQGNSQQSQSGQQQPGQQSVQRAQQNMQNASDNLGDQEAQKAERQQQKAEEELEKALREIEERLNQLREETREEKLARLEARFREMLARQQVASMITLELNDKSVHLGKLRRRDILDLLRLSTEELEISELGQQAYDLLLEDGTSIVFPEIVQNVREDLIRVGQLLETEQTGPLTQLIQREIETTLEELLEALKQTRRNNEGGGGGGGGGGNAPLLRKSAELKMLRAAQLRVNRMTKQFDLIRPSDTLDDAMADAVIDISKRQAEIVEMTLRVMEKGQ